MITSKLEVIASPSEPTIVTRRVVNAPRALVFDVMTKAEHIRHWMGPKALTFVECTSDVRVGGKWRTVLRTPDGQDIGFHGEYTDVRRPERISRTYVFEPAPDHPAVETLVLEERDGKTTIQTTTVHKTVQGRDAHLANGAMEAGMTEGYARMDELLATLLSGKRTAAEAR